MAAAQVETATVGVKASPTTDTTRKRRRRMPTTGAAEDCFTCRKRQTQCDRRRPYCSQCLEFGKDCSGYRTTLTWGVGVASRGKLRGMSLPIAKGEPGQQQQQQQQQQQHQKQSSTATANRKASIASSSRANPSAGPEGNVDTQTARKRVRLTPLKTTEANSGAAPLHTTAMGYPSHLDYHTSDHPRWHAPPFGAHHEGFVRQDQTPRMTVQDRRHDLFPLHSATGGSFHDAPWASPTATVDRKWSFNGFAAEAAINHPNGYSIATPDPSPMDQYPSSSTAPAWHYPVWQSPAETAFPPQMPPPPQPSLMGPMTPVSQPSPVTGPETPSAEISQWNTTHNHQPRVRSFSESLETLWAKTIPQINGSPVSNGQEEDDSPDSSPDGTQLTMQPVGIDQTGLSEMPHRIRYLVDYYDKAICPVLVALDDGSNPYRMHILPLVSKSPGLQNALAALTTNNMRMKNLKDVPHMDADSTRTKQLILSAIGVPSPEEQHYKTMSIDILNKQLASSEKAKDDSVLATLLILCLFHVCDSGFSKFKTQLAGVQKLLKLRGNKSNNEFVGWVEMFFAWFDVMTAAVNDRETLVHGDSLDLMDLSKDLGALEQFSGCEGRLFKLISKLGRLNLLSQGRNVKELPEVSSLKTSAKPPLKRSAWKDFYSLHEDDASESYWEGLTAPQIAKAIKSEPSESPDAREQFWAEWDDLRIRLNEWDLDLSSSPSGEQHHLNHMSQSFRYSALLYTERLAHPSLAASSNNFQRLVSQSLHHIEEIGVNSCVTKFMLWPLFITGTECVMKEHRDLIRDRCVEIQKESGFYNNLNGLAVLEKIWKDGDREAEIKPASCAAQTFRWRSAMNRVDGEYIVV